MGTGPDPEDPANLYLPSGVIRNRDLSNVEALRCATREAARALALDSEIGALAPGFAADILVVDGDPLEDLSALLSPRLVVARGRAVPAAG